MARFLPPLPQHAEDRPGSPLTWHDSSCNPVTVAVPAWCLQDGLIDGLRARTDAIAFNYAPPAWMGTPL